MNIFKIFRKKPKKRTLEETEKFIQKNFYFNRFHEELIDEIYSLLLEYGNPFVEKINDRHFLITLNGKTYKVTENGFTIDKI